MRSFSANEWGRAAAYISVTADTEEAEDRSSPDVGVGGAAGVGKTPATRISSGLCGKEQVADDGHWW
jgi:hypothetical protein